MFTRSILAAAGALALSFTLAVPAEAKCTRLGFSVNDYGKDGPTKDAKDLLDKHIAKWAAENGIAKYTTGKKDVKCELFLDFIVFDEHTCRAEANVCWNEKAPAAKAAATPELTATPKAAAAPAMKKTGADITTGTIAKPAPQQ